MQEFNSMEIETLGTGDQIRQPDTGNVVMLEKVHILR